MAQTSTQSALESAVLDDFASPLSAAQTSHVPTRCERTSSLCVQQRLESNQCFVDQDLHGAQGGHSLPLNPLHQPSAAEPGFQIS